MNPGLASRARGFSLFELIVVVFLMATLSGVALDRLLPLVGRAQRVSFLQVQGELQSALLLAAAERITRGESRKLAELAGANPMSMLLKGPDNYVGSFKRPRPNEVPTASWYYDEQDRFLVYRVGNYTRFDPLDGPKDRIELKVNFLYDDVDGEPGFDASHDRFAGLSLDSVHAYRWPD